MSNEIKVGDKVRVREDAPRMYFRTMSTKFLGVECGVFEIIDGNAAIASGCDYIAIPLKYLVKVDDEAKEANVKIGSDKWVDKTVWNNKNHKKGVIRRMTDGGIKQEWKRYMTELVEPKEQTEVEKPNHTIKIPVEVDLTDSYWDAYAANLAKEVALKVANKYDPEEVSEYAVSVAKAVVEGLKRK